MLLVVEWQPASPGVKQCDASGQCRLGFQCHFPTCQLLPPLVNTFNVVWVMRNRSAQLQCWDTTDSVETTFVELTRGLLYLKKAFLNKVPKLFKWTWGMLLLELCSWGILGFCYKVTESTFIQSLMGTCITPTRHVCSRQVIIPVQIAHADKAALTPIQPLSNKTLHGCVAVVFVNTLRPKLCLRSTG